MAILRTTVLATAVAAAGLASTAGVALANESGSDGPTVQKGLVNSSDFAPNTPINLCNNDVPVNAGGVQIPLQDLAGNIPLLSEAHSSGNSAGHTKSCASPIDARN